MDTVIPYFHKVIDYTADFASPHIPSEQLDKICLWLKENDESLIWSLGALTLATLIYVVGSSGSNTEKRNKKKQVKRSHKVKIKKEKIIPIDPIKLSYDTINSVKSELDTVFIPQVDQLEKDVALETETGENLDGAYKESTEYRYLYLNEALLKLLMRMDGVEPNGIEEIRTKRKAVIKEIQVQCKRVDALKKN